MDCVVNKWTSFRQILYLVLLNVFIDVVSVLELDVDVFGANANFAWFGDVGKLLGDIGVSERRGNRRWREQTRCS